MPTPDRAVSVVIPTYKSANILPTLYARLKKVLDSTCERYEIIMVNDCSPDDSWRTMVDLAADDPNFKPVCLRKNCGYDRTIMAGLTLVQFPLVVVMDDDLQHAPEDIPALLLEAEKGHDVVYANFIVKKQSLLKNIGSWLNGKMAEVIIGKPKGLYLSPFKVIRKDVTDEIIRYNGPFPYIDGLLFQVTSSIHQIPIEHNRREEGMGNHGLLRSIGIVVNFCTTFSIIPLRVSTFSGIALSVLAAGFGILLVVCKLLYGVDVEGWTSIMLAIIVMGGIQLVMLGIVGEYVGRAYMNLNSRPQFTIRLKINSENHDDNEG